MLNYGIFLLLGQLCDLFPNVTPTTSHNLHLVRCLRTISERYFAPTQTLVVSWPHNHILHTRLNISGMSLVTALDGRNRSRKKLRVNKARDVDVMADLLLPQLSRWTLVLYGNTCERNERNDNYMSGSYIILTSTDTDDSAQATTLLRHQLRHLANSSAWNPRAHFVVALLQSSNNPSLKAQGLLEDLWKHKVTHAVVLVSSNEQGGTMVPGWRAYTWFPYQTAERCFRVQDVTLLDTWVKRGNGYFLRNTHLFPQKIGSNLHGCPLRIITQPTIFTVLDPHYEFINRSAVPKVVYRDGWEIKLLNIITRALNMTEDYLLPLDDFWNLTDYKGDYAGFTRELMQSRADVSVGLLVVRESLPVDATRPYHWGQLSWYVPCGSRYPRWISISRIFSGCVWVLVMMSVLLSVPIITFLARFSEDSGYETGSNTLYSAWAVILSVSVPAMPRTWPLRFFFMSWIWYSLAVGTVFQTYLTSFLIDPGVMPHARNLEELAETNMKLGFSYRDGVFYEDRADAQSRKIMSKKVECESKETCFVWATKYKNLSILTSDILYKFQSSINVSGETNSNSLCRIEDGVVEHGPIVMVLPRGSCLLDKINNIILHIVEAGIFGEWVKMSDYIHMVKRKAFFPHGLSDEYYKLSLEHLQSAFYLLMFGSCLSFIIFVTELICNCVLSS